jgi:hypothetical protein
MRTLPVNLKVGILDADRTSAGALKAIIETKDGIEEVRVFGTLADANHAFRYEGFNGLFIDIFSLGVETGVGFIEDTRSEYPIVSICLYSPSFSLVAMPGVDAYWRSRFGHYYRVAKDLTIEMLDDAVEDALYGIAYDVQTVLARRKVTDLRRLTEETAQAFSAEQKREIEETVDVVEKALESKEAASHMEALTIPGVNTAQMEQLVNHTLSEASNSLRITTSVNIGVLATGSLLIMVSFVVASVTNRWEAVAFGGLGMAGIIASLITNPLKSIGASARRLVQIQAAYFGFLAQLVLLNQTSEGVSVIDRSKRLEEAMAQTLKTLGEYFGE